jgi:hypothetical protein
LVTAVQPLVVDPAVAEHLEVLGLVPFRRVGVVEAVGHAHALDRLLLHAVDRHRVGQPGHLQDGRGDVDDVVELRADLALGLDPAWPVDDGAVAGPAPVGGDLLGPLIRGVHEDMNSGVSRAPKPPRVIISLKVPCSEPSAEAPFSPMIR